MSARNTNEQLHELRQDLGNVSRFVAEALRRVAALEKRDTAGETISTALVGVGPMLMPLKPPEPLKTRKRKSK